MSLRFDILSDLGLVYVRHAGKITITETEREIAKFARDPKAVPGMKQLVDLSQVTGYEQDYARMLEMQMRKVEPFVHSAHQTLIVYFAPTQLTQKLAQMISHSWDEVEGVVVRVLSTPRECLDVLGLDRVSLDDLKVAADQKT